MIGIHRSGDFLGLSKLSDKSVVGIGNTLRTGTFPVRRKCVTNCDMCQREGKSTGSFQKSGCQMLLTSSQVSKLNGPFADLL